MPVAMLVMVPTSRGVQLRYEGLPCLADAGKGLVENVLEALWFHASLALCSGLGSPLRLGLRLQQFGDALFQRREVIGDAPGQLLSIRC